MKLKIFCSRNTDLQLDCNSPFLSTHASRIFNALVHAAMASYVNFPENIYESIEEDGCSHEQRNKILSCMPLMFYRTYVNLEVVLKSSFS